MTLSRPRSWSYHVCFHSDSKGPQLEEPGVEAEEVKETAGEDVDAIPSQEMTISDATERQIVAASLIQWKYLGLVITLGYIFAYFWARSARTFYFVCLDTVRTDTLSHKNETKDRLKGCSPNEYDTLDDLLDQQGEQGCHRTTKASQPKLCIPTSMDLSGELHLAIRGIVTVCRHTQDANT
ncbi:hypothetical protein ARMSODRAFT_1089447 [Armillaria solidipes]|uniref:Uncharacterized protein n=1 Tax=Armillaria solidipes TaxID=1076256 RepID=A0A2H3AT90_9AGAR|nr:hypothetical protein ARMSODRAFT_1089447 [Armillaria solidipes]